MEFRHVLSSIHIGPTGPLKNCLAVEQPPSIGYYFPCSLPDRFIAHSFQHLLSRHLPKPRKFYSFVDAQESLADIARGFRVLKSEIEIGPVFHRLPERIRAHASICFIALILYRVMRQRLKAADSDLSPERALEQLQRLQ